VEKGFPRKNHLKGYLGGNVHNNDLKMGQDKSAPIPRPSPDAYTWTEVPGEWHTWDKVCEEVLKQNNQHSAQFLQVCSIVQMRDPAKIEKPCRLNRVNTTRTCNRYEATTPPPRSFYLAVQEKSECTAKDVWVKARTLVITPLYGNESAQDVLAARLTYEESPE
jgi:hypothetical protein